MTTYPLDKVSLAVLVGDICGADDWEGVEVVAESSLDWLPAPFRHGGSLAVDTDRGYRPLSLPIFHLRPAAELFATVVKELWEKYFHSNRIWTGVNTILRSRIRIILKAFALIPKAWHFHSQLDTRRSD